MLWQILTRLKIAYSQSLSCICSLILCFYTKYKVDFDTNSTIQKSPNLELKRRRTDKLNIRGILVNIEEDWHVSQLHAHVPLGRHAFEPYQTQFKSGLWKKKTTSFCVIRARIPRWQFESPSRTNEAILFESSIRVFPSHPISAPLSHLSSTPT